MRSLQYIKTIRRPYAFIINFLQANHRRLEVVYLIIRNQHEFKHFIRVKVWEPLVSGFRSSPIVDLIHRGTQWVI